MKKKAPKSLVTRIKQTVEDIFSATPKDIVDAIKLDHKSLRNFIHILKNTDEVMTERRRAYLSFSALLKSHTTAEENVVYATARKLVGRELQIKIAEGFVEHRLAEDIMKRIERSKDALSFSAHANVLAEIVEHHLKEEESDLLPLLQRTASARMNQTMLKKFIALRVKTQKRVTRKNAGVLKKTRPG